ncbi:hypothetical protein NPA08_04340 [Mycoplasmopsis citelli]|nr:hypothetical protein [Mycoplasmopsis citelli]UUD36149.1 hypothetical protein NPA08_04340 [Mycoplasmopsis citelli]
MTIPKPLKLTTKIWKNHTETLKQELDIFPQKNLCKKVIKNLAKM